MGSRNFLHRRRYLWNLVRGKAFYLAMVDHLVDLCNGLEYGAVLGNEIEDIIVNIFESEKYERTRRSFVWNLTKRVPLVTVQTVALISEERLMNIVRGERCITDAHMRPLVSEIWRLMNRNREIASANDAILKMMNDGSD